MLLKKNLLLTLIVTLMIPLGVQANDIGGTAADPEDSQENQDAHLSTVDFVIDGDLSEWEFNNPVTDPLIGIPKVGRDDREEGTEPSQFVVHEELGGTWTGPDDQSSMSEFVYKTGTGDPDIDGLYIGIVVTDDYHENEAASGWNGDALQMMVTFYDTDAEAHDPADFALYNFALPGVEGDIEEEPELVKNIEKKFEFFDPADEDINLAIVRNEEAGETYYEMFLGTEAMGFDADEFVEGAKFGIGMAINDGDEDAPGQKGWIGLGAHAIVFGKSPAETALFTLAGEFEGPMCDPNSKGDLNGDGTVNFTDFLILSENFGRDDVMSEAEGDINCDGEVAFADFLILSENFGTEVASAVPEPTSLGLFGLGVFALGMLRKRR